MNENKDTGIETITYLKDVCSYLFHEEEPQDERNNIADDLKIVTEDLGYMRQEYDSPAPRGAEGARDVMLDILALFDRGIEGMLQYIEDEDREHLTESLDCFAEAEQILDSLRMAIDQYRLELAELLSKLESGEISEGEKIDEDSDMHLSITDMEGADLIVPENELPRAPETKLLDGYGAYTDEDIENEHEYEVPATETLDYDELNLSNQDEA
ncbi:MAG: hypothetical protein K8T10_13550 [Candidatus Eremiobacteraeota bacterium]|nr:hypothetical protein [Candidatus Eremiobacteraeota bacterium]